MHRRQDTQFLIGVFALVAALGIAAIVAVVIFHFLRRTMLLQSGVSPAQCVCKGPQTHRLTEPEQRPIERIWPAAGRRMAEKLAGTKGWVEYYRVGWFRGMNRALNDNSLGGWDRIQGFEALVQDREALHTATEIVRWKTSKGWDEEYGGLPQFLHIDGGKPRGVVVEQNKDDHMIVELTENWSNKLWWVHSEALYALILAYEHTRDSWFMDAYWKFHDYVFKTFPNPDKGIGEWIQIRDRQGRPEDKVVALPVKDPYHITRAFMHLIKSLERIEANLS